MLGFFSDFFEPNTILLTGDKGALEAIAANLSSLEDPTAQKLDIHLLSFITSFGDIKLVAFPVGRELGIRRTDPLKPHFSWQLSEEGWLEVAEKIWQVANCSSCHTWIESQGADDAVLLVSRGEYNQVWWRTYGPSTAPAST